MIVWQCEQQPFVLDDRSRDAIRIILTGTDEADIQPALDGRRELLRRFHLLRCKVTSDLWPLYARISAESTLETAAEGEYPITIRSRLRQ